MKVAITGTSGLAKIIKDIPLPIPLCEINSPSHMINAVPAVIVSTINPTLDGV